MRASSTSPITRYLGFRPRAVGGASSFRETVSIEPTARDRGDGAATSDAALIAGLLAGEEFATSAARRWVRGASIPYRSRLAAELEDVEQEVLIDLLTALRAGRFEGRSQLSTYVRRIVHYKCLNRIRSRRRHQWVEVDEAELVDPAPSPFELARRRGDLEIALRVLAEMPESCRELWGMIQRGLGYDAMSESLGLAAGTLRVRVLRCREKALAVCARLAAGTGNESRTGVT